MAVVEEVEAALDKDHSIGRLRLSVVAEMHDSAGGSQEMRVGNSYSWSIADCG